MDVREARCLNRASWIRPKFNSSDVSTFFEQTSCYVLLSLERPASSPLSKDLPVSTGAILSGETFALSHSLLHLDYWSLLLNLGDTLSQDSDRQAMNKSNNYNLYQPWVQIKEAQFSEPLNFLLFLNIMHFMLTFSENFFRCLFTSMFTDNSLLF